MNINKILFSLLIVVVVSAKAEVFLLPGDVGVSKQTDSEGVVRFSKSGFAKSKQKSTKKKIPSVTATTAGTSKSSAPHVEIYYANWDPVSQKALIFFRENHIVINNAYDIEANDAAAARKKTLAPDYNGMPLVIINDVIIRGLDEALYYAALAKKPVAQTPKAPQK